MVQSIKLHSLNKRSSAEGLRRIWYPVNHGALSPSKRSRPFCTGLKLSYSGSASISQTRSPRSLLARRKPEFHLLCFIHVCLAWHVYRMLSGLCAWGLRPAKAPQTVVNSKHSIPKPCWVVWALNPKPDYFLPHLEQLNEKPGQQILNRKPHYVTNAI